MSYLIACLGVMFLTTFLTRSMPFLFAARVGGHPRLKRLGRQLPAAIMLLLCLQCFSEVDYLTFPHGLCELLASCVVLAAHCLLRNSLVSIALGTLAFGLLSHWAAVTPPGPLHTLT